MRKGEQCCARARSGASKGEREIKRQSKRGLQEDKGANWRSSVARFTAVPPALT